MSEARQDSEARADWARAAATQDGELASLASGGALLLWDPADQAPIALSAGGRAFLGKGLTFPPQTRQRLTLLAGGPATPREG